MAKKGAISTKKGASLQSIGNHSASPSKEDAIHSRSSLVLTLVTTDQNVSFDLSAEPTHDDSVPAPLQVSKGDALKILKRLNVEKSDGDPCVFISNKTLLRGLMY